MATFGDIERAFADLYEYRFLIGTAFIIAFAAAVYAAYRLGWHLFVMRHKTPFIIFGTPVAIVALFLAWSLASPLFTNVTVEEEFPFALSAAVPEGMERGDVELVMAGMAMVDDPVMEEAMPLASSITAGSMMAAGEDVVSMSVDDVAGMMASGADPGAMQTMMAATAAQMGEVRQVTAGNFKDADAFHRGSGQALIFSAPGGGHLLRLENLDVTNGPALHVILSTHPNPTRGNEVKLSGYADLGPLKGNRGNQNYTIPADVDISAIQSVVIYCKPFSVVFSVATLGA
ncbi:MAG: DM13 domain-containing protein [Chloroflexota bacterium]|nr:DM13 domain-containing protein [Chloroflexota bacterium]MDE2969853.1 DM13 domain-containing protein [Chloroflexota bacterium]